MNVVWFAEIKWDYLKTRKQQIITRKPDDVRLLFLEPYVKGRSNRYGLRREGGVLCATVPFVKPAPGPAVRALLDQAWVRVMVDQIAHGRVRRLIGEAGFELGGAGVVLSNVYAVRVARRIPRRFLLYDCNDAHADFPGAPSWAREYQRLAVTGADHVFATSAALLEDVVGIRGGDSGCEFLGNGVDYEHFERSRETAGPAAPPSPPRIGYLGAVAPWFNFDIVEHLAAAHPDWEIELVGPVMLGVGAVVEKLAARPNVKVLPPVPYRDVPRVLKRFSVGIIPFRYDALTRGVNPNKMYEYLAAGVPVVASRFSAEVQKYPELVKAPESTEGFVRSCEEFVALWGDDARLAGFREGAYRVASEHDWRRVADSFWRRVRLLYGE